MDNETGSVDDLFIYRQIISEQRRQIDNLNKRNKDLEEKESLRRSLWNKMKSLYSVEQVKLFYSIYKCYDGKTNANGYCDMERFDWSKRVQTHNKEHEITKIMRTPLKTGSMDKLPRFEEHRTVGNLRKRIREMESLSKQKEERIQALEHQISELKKDVELAYKSLSIERNESEGFIKKLEEQLRQSEKEKDTAQKLLQNQQREMGEIKRIAKTSFMKVAKSNTIDNPETARKNIARASELYESLQVQRAKNGAFSDLMHSPNAYEKDSSTTQSDSISFFDSIPKRHDGNSYGPPKDDRNKTAPTVMIATNVNFH